MSTNLSILLLVATLKVGSISRSKEDKELSAELEESTGAQKDEVRATKALFKEALAPINSIESKARKLHGQLTFTGIGDDRLLAPAERERHEATLAPLRSKWQAAVSDFLGNYATHLAREQTLKGTAFKLEDYPTREAAADRFRFEVGYHPMGDPNQFLRIFADQAQQAQATELRTRYERQIREAVANVTRTQFNEVLNLVRRVSQVLGDPNAPLIDSPTRKGPLTYLREYVERLPMTNIEGDPNIERLRLEVMSTLDVSTEILRESKLLRADTANRAKEIVESFAALGVRRFAA